MIEFYIRAFFNGMIYLTVGTALVLVIIANIARQLEERGK